MWRRARLRGTVVVVLLGALGVWLSVGLVLGLPVVGGEATVRHCDALGGVRTRVCRWVGRPLLPDGRHEVPAQVVIGAVLLVAALLVARALTARNRNGPVRVTEVQLGGGANGSPDPRTAATLALIRECLHTAGVNAQGVVPSYSGIATSGAEVVGAAGYPAPVNLLTRMSVAWVQTSVLNLGWVVTVTETPAEAPFRCGLTYSVQRVVTGVIEMTDTCWGTGLEDCARKVGYQLAAWREQNGRAGRDRRGGPSTSPHSLRHQHEALLDARHRRFDATIQRARAGLNADPTNMRLRRILGETYERLGLGLDAFIVYASGLIFMDDTRNGWRRTLSAGDAMGEASKVADAGRQGWQPRRDPRRRDPRRRDPDRQGVLWRYIATLHMCDTWLDVLVAEACRVDDRHRPHGGHGGDHPWFTPRTRSPWADLPAVDHELSDRLRAGAERAGLVRGFLSQRYGAVLEREHPLLHRGWFAERGRRLLPFMVDKDLAAALITQPSPAAPDLTARWACVVPTLHIRPGRPAAPPTWSAVSAAAEFRDLCDALTALAQVARIAQDHYNDDPLCAAVADAVAAAVPWVHPTAHDLPSMTTGLEEVVAAVRAADGTVWRRLGLTRPVVLQLASRLIMQVSTLHRRHHDRSDMPASPPPSPIDAPLHAVAGLLARALAAIDLKLVLLRCSLQDLHDLAHDRADTAALGPQPLVALQEVMARHKYGTRLLFLHRACAFWTALLPAAQASGSPPVPDPAAAAVAELDSAAHEAIAAIATPGTEARWRRRAARGLAPWRTVESWNLPYYAACAYAATIPDHPDQADGEADPFDDWTPGGADRDSLITAQYERWCRAYDRHALLAVQQLDRAVEQRARAASSANAKGVADWILGEDPDLDLLRRHPRFRRWAAHHFQVTLLPDWHSRGFAEMRAARRALSVREVTIGPAPYVTVAEQCSLGVLGCAEPWNRENVRWGLAHGHYLTIGLQLAVPAAVRYLHSLADKVDATDPDAARREQNDRLALTVATYGQELHRFWSCLPMYRLLSWQPEFRLQLSQSLRRLADLDGHMLPGFPREFEVLQVARFLDYQVIDAALQQRVRGGLEHADQLASAAVPAASTLPQAPYLGASNPARQAALLRQAALDLGGLLADFQKALGTPSSHH